MEALNISIVNNAMKEKACQKRKKKQWGAKLNLGVGGSIRKAALKKWHIYWDLKGSWESIIWKTWEGGPRIFKSLLSFEKYRPSPLWEKEEESVPRSWRRPQCRCWEGVRGALRLGVCEVVSADRPSEVHVQRNQLFQCCDFSQEMFSCSSDSARSQMAVFLPELTFCLKTHLAYFLTVVLMFISFILLLSLTL